ncbi:MAG: ATP-binding protein [Caulobacter sp.]|nr:ATP-binding protein [Caulobacter sp.]
MTSNTRDKVFIAGGQPSVTYVERKQLHIERELARAIAVPNQLVSLSGPSKSGKTVLCRHVLGEKQYIWIEGGQTPTAKEVWDKIVYELNFPVEIEEASGTQTGFKAGIKGLILSASGSQLYSDESKRTYRIDSMASALKHLRERDIILVIDDFHYLEASARKDFVRNVKGAVFGGLKVVLLSVSHRTFDAIKAESELTGRFMSVSVPEWSQEDLALIPEKGFGALNVQCPEKVVGALAEECQGSPFIMQKLCWDICFDLDVDTPADPPKKVPANIDLEELYIRIAKDSGLPIYERLVAGPQIRKERIKRPLAAGGEADVYEVTLLAIAETGPLKTLSYNEVRTSMANMLTANVPQKHEITSVLKHLAKISRDIGTDVGVDWDEDKKQVDISDPYLRFYLRWQVRQSVGH